MRVEPSRDRLCCAVVLALAGCKREDSQAAAADRSARRRRSWSPQAVAGRAGLPRPDRTTVAVESVTIQPQVAGKIIEVHFTDGADVKKGQLLFTIDPRPFKAALAEAEAELAENRATLQVRAGRGEARRRRPRHRRGLATGVREERQRRRRRRGAGQGRRSARSTRRSSTSNTARSSRPSTAARASGWSTPATSSSAAGCRRHAAARHPDARPDLRRLHRHRKRARARSASSWPKAACPAAIRRAR